MPKNHHIENIIKLAPTAKLTPLENAQKSSYRKYYKVGIKSKAKPFWKMPKNHHIENIINLASKARVNPLENAKYHHIENIINLASKARVNPLENAQKSSYRKYYKFGIIS